MASREVESLNRSVELDLRHQLSGKVVSGVVSCSLLKRCRLVAPLGRGGMAEVFLAACDVAPNERYPVAIKRLYPHFGDDPTAVQMLHDEARLVSGLSHRNIVKLYEIGVLNDAHCLVMEYLAGQPLQRLMFRRQQAPLLPVELSAYIVTEVLDALDYAYNAPGRNHLPLRVIHRDISPQNVFVTNDGQVKLLDFGIAKATSHEGRTVTGLVKGKFAYIAPEQAMGQPVDGRADLWSVGVILWELLSGKRLFKADNEAATLRATLRAEVPRLSTLRAGIPVVLERIVERSLQRHASLRYADAAEMKSELLRYLRSLPQVPDVLSIATHMKATFGREIDQQKELLSHIDESVQCPEVRTVARRPDILIYPSTEVSSTRTYDSSATEVGVENASGNVKFNRRTQRLGVVFIAIIALTTIVAAGFLGVGERLFANEERKPSATSLNAPKNLAGFDRTVEASTPRSEEKHTNERGGSSVLSGTTSEASRNQSKPQRRVAMKRAETVASSKGEAVLFPPPSGTGFLTLDTTPWSTVNFLGVSIGQTPIIGAKLPVGTHQLVLRNPEVGIETAFWITIVEGKTTTKRIGLQ